jgi:ADP-heptose:LPS heptosyltransferase
MTRLSYLCGHQVEQHDWDATHGVEQTLRIARYVGAFTNEPHLVYAVTEEETSQLNEKLRRMLVGAKPMLVLQLGGGRRASWRDWPVERYAELIRLCARELVAEIFVLGGEDQTERLRELDHLFANEGGKPYHDVVNKFSLAESAALLASARALVSTDTGIMHLGFAVGTRVVAVIHCNNPAHRVGPYGYGDRHRVVQLPRPTNYQTPADASMADISAETVFEQLKEIWD